MINKTNLESKQFIWLIIINIGSEDEGQEPINVRIPAAVIAQNPVEDDNIDILPMGIQIIANEAENNVEQEIIIVDGNTY